MSVVEYLHDEELLERARAGTLTPELRQRLRAHCGACEACAMELRWIEDGLQRLAPTADDVAAGMRAVEAVLGGPLERQLQVAQQGSPGAAGAVASARGRRPAGPWRWLFNIAAGLALCLVSTGALAAVWGGVVRVREIWIDTDDGTTPAAPVDQASAVRARPRGWKAPREEASAPATRQVLATPAEAAEAAPKASRSFPEMRASASGSPSDDATKVAPLRPSRRARAERWLRLANRARSRGHYPDALARYLELERHFPSTRAGEVAILAAARLLQRHLHDPAAALAAYRRYLALPASPPLLEEARLGVALCAGQLDDPAAERRAWRDLLVHHPGSLHARKARERLAVLDANLRGGASGTAGR